MRVFLTLISLSNKNMSCMRFGESWQARVSMRVFLTRLNSHDLVKREQELHESW